ncbi:MAG: hypothetical protein ACKVH8_21630 [Pirellulales bacterium]
MNTRILWENVLYFLIFPFLVIGGVLVLGIFSSLLIVVGIILIPIFVICVLFQPLQDRIFRRRMIDTGRYLTLEQLEQKLAQGTGTLLLIGSRRPVWWTSDDIVAKAPLELPRNEKIEQSEELKEIAEACDTKYTDYQAGIGQYVDVPYNYSNQDLESMFPNAKILTILTSYRGYEIVQGNLHRTEKTHLEE